MTVALLLTTEGCADMPAPMVLGDAGAGADASPSDDVVRVVQVEDAAPSDSVAPAMRPLGCTPEGRGILQVRLQIAPQIAERDLWISVLCSTTASSRESDERPMRVMRVMRGMSSVDVTGLGEGYYRVIASALGSLPATSSSVPVGTGTTSTSVSIGGGNGAVFAAEGVLESGFTMVPPLPVPTPSVEYDLRATNSADSVGRISVQFRARSTDWLDAVFAVSNGCAGSACPSLRLQAIELRIERDGLPRALVVVPFVTGSSRGLNLGPLESFMTDPRLLPLAAIARGARVQVAVFGLLE